MIGCGHPNPQRRRAMLTVLWAAALALTGLILVGLALALPPRVLAFERDLRAARARYPNIVGTRLDTCALCHVSHNDYGLNPYGRAFDGAGRDFGAIENVDSDGDGFDNRVEILALTFPGNASDFPSATPTSGPTSAPTEMPSATATVTTAPTGPPPTTAAPPPTVPSAAPTPAATVTPPISNGLIYLPVAERP
jgi:hypothetical protein